MRERVAATPSRVAVDAHTLAWGHASAPRRWEEHAARLVRRASGAAARFRAQLAVESAPPTSPQTVGSRPRAPEMRSLRASVRGSAGARSGASARSALPPARHRLPVAGCESPPPAAADPRNCRSGRLKCKKAVRVF